MLQDFEPSGRSTHVIKRLGDPVGQVDLASHILLEEGVLLQERVVEGQHSARALLSLITRTTHHQLPISRPPPRHLLQTLGHEILRGIPIPRGQRRWVPVDDGRELRKDVLVRLGWVGVVADGEFDDGEAEGPDVRGGRVGRSLPLGLALYALGL